MSKYIVPLDQPKKVKQTTTTTVKTRSGEVHVPKVTPYYETEEGKKALEQYKKKSK